MDLDPEKKYVLLFPEASADEAERILEALRSFVDDEWHTLLAIYGQDVTIVPADQVVGYKLIQEENNEVYRKSNCA